MLVRSALVVLLVKLAIVWSSLDYGLFGDRLKRRDRIVQHLQTTVQSGLFII